MPSVLIWPEWSVNRGQGGIALLLVSVLIWPEWSVNFSSLIDLIIPFSVLIWPEWSVNTLYLKIVVEDPEGSHLTWVECKQIQFQTKRLIIFKFSSDLSGVWRITEQNKIRNKRILNRFWFCAEVEVPEETGPLLFLSKPPQLIVHPFLWIQPFSSWMPGDNELLLP